MKRFAFLLTVFLAACTGADEVNVADYDDLEQYAAGEDLEAVADEYEDEKSDQAPTGIVIEGDRYIIQAGDTLADIAIAAGIDLASLMRWNVIDDPNRIFIGEEIVLTGAAVIEYADAVVNNVVVDTRNFVLNSQEEDEILYWNAAFFEALDIRHLYLHFLRDGGEPRNIEEFVAHLGQNAPVLTDWQDIAKVVYNDLGVNAFEAVPGRPGYYYALDTSHPDLLIGIINARTGELIE